MRVRALEMGFYMGDRKRPGAEFSLRDGEKPAKWMEPIEKPEQPKAEKQKPEQPKAEK